MSMERARKYLEQYGVAERIIEFSVSSATVELAAKAAGVEPGRIAKTLSLMTPSGCILVVAAGDAKLSNTKYKERFATKAKMLGFEEVERLTGHAVGGVCPFGICEGIEVYLDGSLRRFSTVFPACGSANSAIELSIEELERISRAGGWVDVCEVK